MAFGQIDPARLQGEALRRWYLRSPAQIEGERHEAAKRAYEDFFFSPLDAERERPVEAVGFDGEGYIWSQTGDRRWSGRRASTDRQAVGEAQVREVAAGPPTDFWNDWTPCNTLSCHGRPAPAAPPRGGGQSPLPPSYLPRTGGEGRSKRRDFRQCDVQYANDSEVCRSLPEEDVADRQACWESASERQQFCRANDGQVGWPRL